MSNFDLSKLMEGKNPQAVMLEETRQLKGKWEQTGLLEGLKERDQHQMSVLLENQAKQLLDEANATSTTTGNEEWSGVALPLVRRIFGEISSKEFVSVQPMNLPSGLIFYLDFKYNNGQFGGTNYSGSSLFGGDGSDLGSTNVAQNGLYGDGRFGYTLSDKQKMVVSGNVSVETASVFDDLNYDSRFTASVEAGNIFKATITKSNIDSTADNDAIRGFYLTTSGSEIDENLNAFNKVDGSSYVFFFSGSGEDVGAVEVHYASENSAGNRGDFEDRDPVLNTSGSDGATLDIPEIDLELKSEAIVAKTRKLKAV